MNSPSDHLLWCSFPCACFRIVMSVHSHADVEVASGRHPCQRLEKLYWLPRKDFEDHTQFSLQSVCHLISFGQLGQHLYSTITKSLPSWTYELGWTLLDHWRKQHTIPSLLPLYVVDYYSKWSEVEFTLNIMKRFLQRLNCHL